MVHGRGPKRCHQPPAVGKKMESQDRAVGEAVSRRESPGDGQKHGQVLDAKREARKSQESEARAGDALRSGREAPGGRQRCRRRVCLPRAAGCRPVWERGWSRVRALDGTAHDKCSGMGPWQVAGTVCATDQTRGKQTYLSLELC